MPAFIIVQVVQSTPPNANLVFLIVAIFILVFVYMLGYSIGSRKLQSTETEKSVTVEKNLNRCHSIKVIGPNGNTLFSKEVMDFDNDFVEDGYVEFTATDGKFGCIQSGENLVVVEELQKLIPQ